MTQRVNWSWQGGCVEHSINVCWVNEQNNVEIGFEAVINLYKGTGYERLLYLGNGEKVMFLSF